MFAGVLINVNVFTFAAVGRSGPGDFRLEKAGWRNRVPFRPLAIARSKADMVDVHFYSGTLERYQQDLESIEFDELKRATEAAGKPLIAGDSACSRISSTATLKPPAGFYEMNGYRHSIAIGAAGCTGPTTLTSKPGCGTPPTAVFTSSRFWRRIEESSAEAFMGF